MQDAALGTPHGEAPEVQTGQYPRDVAAQREYALLGKLPQLFRAGGLPLGRVLGQGQLDEVRLDATFDQHPVDGHQSVAIIAEVHRSVDARKSWTQRRLIDDNRGGSFRIRFLHTKTLWREPEAWNDFRRSMPL